MKNYLILLTAFTSLFCLINSCISSKEDVNDSQILKGEYLVLDSIKVFNQDYSFSYFNLDKIDEDKILAFQYPVLNLSLLTKRGELVREISRQGVNVGQFQGQFIDIKWYEDELFILEQGAKFGITIFDYNLNFKKYINLNSVLPNTFIFPKVSSFHIEKINNKFILYLSKGSDEYNYYLPEYYRKVKSVVRIVFDEKMTPKSIDTFLPFIEFQTVEDAIKENKRTWTNPNTFFEVGDKEIYLKYSFDDNIYIVDKISMKIKSTIFLNRKNYFDQDEKYFVSFSSPNMTPSRVISDMMKLSYYNADYHGIKIEKNKVYVQSTVPIPLEKIKDNPSKLSEMNIKSLIHTIDLDTKVQKYYIFPEKFSFSFFYIKDNILYLSSNQNLSENPYLFKIKLL